MTYHRHERRRRMLCLRYIVQVAVFAFSLHSIHTAEPVNPYPYSYVDKFGVFGDRFIPWDDYYHNPAQVKNWPPMAYPNAPPKYVNGSLKMINPLETEDYRLPTPPYTLEFTPQNYQDSGRFYRLNPKSISGWMWHRFWEKPENLNCYCVTVYKRLIPLGMGAVLTFRHILTTALSTELIIRRYKHKKTLHNILGAWYNTDQTYNTAQTNTSYYMTPARIHYHPKWNPPHMVNRSHPLPNVYDLAIWTSTTSFYYDPTGYRGSQPPNQGFYTCLCQRWSNKQGGNLYPTNYFDLMLIIGCQMSWNLGRTPYPWFRYALRMNSFGMINCPKNDWDWYLCVICYGPVMKMGAEPGAALHLVPLYWHWRTPGLAGLNSFSMRLRSQHFVNYFTVLDRHPVLEFLYDAVKSRLEPAYLDSRFRQEWDKQIIVREDGDWVYQGFGPKPDEWNWNKDMSRGKIGYNPIWWR